MKPIVKAFFDPDTNTISYVVRDPNGRKCAIIDSVLDFDYASGRTSTASADAIIDYVTSENLDVALDLLKQAIAIQKRVLQDAPRHPTSRNFLGVHYENLLEVGKGLDDQALTAEAEKGLAELESSAVEK